MCDLVRIEVTLIHPADNDEQAKAADIGVKGVLHITFGTADIPAEQDIDVPSLMVAIVDALPVIADGIDREWSAEWARRREQAAQQN